MENTAYHIRSLLSRVFELQKALNTQLSLLTQHKKLYHYESNGQDESTFFSNNAEELHVISLRVKETYKESG